MDFREALRRAGFTPSQQGSSRGAQTFSARPNRFLTYWVHASDDGTALFTWEFAITDYLLERGMQLGSAEALNTFLFPVEDERGSQDPAWLAHAMEVAEARLREVDLSNVDGRERD
jgi:hypothetical protein